ncbi:AAA family ATPase [Flavobacterium sp.]|jgi:predicted ATP-dependent endonuclease of OLD family|uniref:AAA family ATPase n=1 Tax=Flavobacterium sp. TaxID=239 RepID=UPI0037BF0BC8
MKISKLHIDSYRHLENLDFDFTYPKDFHIEEKRGKPLDKICFIGQSASGKTSLLELINQTISYFYNLRKISTDEFLDVGNFKHLKINLNFESDLILYKYEKGDIKIDNENLKLYDGTYNGGATDIINYKNNIFFISADILSRQNIKIFEEKTVNLIEKYKDLKNNSNSLLEQNYFGDFVRESIWISFLQERLDYLQKSLQFFNEFLANDFLSESLSKKLEDWKLLNSNPLLNFADKFDYIFKNLNIELDLNNASEIFPLRNIFTKENIPVENISTGTKQLLLTALPLYKLNTTDSIILIDEPERSLYPDMQMDLMEHYKNFAPKAQFIIATHSPFIAASFEPEERFILSFDQEGKVIVNRGSSPIGDDPNDMLYNDFGINYINKYGQQKHNEYLDLKQKVFFEKDENAKKRYVEKLEKLGEEYNF